MTTTRSTTSAVDAPSVVVGVGPYGLAGGTVTLVADTAARLGVGIEVIHVLPTLAGWPTGTIETCLLYTSPSPRD